MWDMKPEGPSAIRGSFRPIRTRLPGTVVCEYLPLLSQRNDRFTLIRSVTHERIVHGGAVGFVLTGTRTRDPGIPGVRGPDATAGDHPGMGATVTRFAQGPPSVPRAVTLPWTLIDGQGRFVPGQTAAMLGGRYDPWFIKADPSDPGFRVEGLALEQGLSVDRLALRRGLLTAIDEQRRRLDDHAEQQNLDAYYDRAFALLTGPATRRAFELRTEPAALRDRYGRNPVGQSCLLARRLIEAGVRLVQVNASGSLFGDYGWDTHSDNFNQLQNKLLPRFDPALSTLLDDLDERRLLGETLVVCMGEFGRSPTISRSAGREHWPFCYTILMAGGGVSRGRVYGRSDKRGAYPVEDPVKPEDLVATVYASLGIDPSQRIQDHLGREHVLVQGRVLHELFS
jgi:hypothetical protein